MGLLITIYTYLREDNLSICSSGKISLQVLLDKIFNSLVNAKSKRKITRESAQVLGDPQDGS